MKVKRIVANVSASAPNKAKRFYQDLLGLDVLMDGVDHHVPLADGGDRADQRHVRRRLGRLHRGR